MPSIAPTQLVRLMVIGIFGGVLLMTLGLMAYGSLRAHQLVIIQREEADELKLDQARQRMKYEAEAMQESLLYHFNQAEDLLREMSREQVNIAHTTATSIYNSAKNLLPDAKIKAIIIEALRKVNFFQGRGYVFINSMEGESILLPTNPELEGTSLLDNRDDKGTYITRKLIATVSNSNKSGYANYRWYQLDNSSEMAEKIAYARQFEPYNWFIGSGDYIFQMENKMREVVLARIKHLKLPNDGYLVVLDEQGRLLTSSSSPEDVGKLPKNFTNPHQQQVVKMLLDTANQGGGYVEYEWHRLGYEGLYTKLGYVVKVPETGWVLIATGYRDLILADPLPPKSWLSSFLEKFTLLVWPLLAIGLITLLVAMVYARWLGRLLNYYQLNIVEQQGRLQILAEMDSLTNLPNRWSMGQGLTRAMDKAAINNHKLALFVIDVDHFKNINDSLGHALGDKVLQEIGRRMQACIQQQSFVARMGGDEFVLLVDPAGDYDELVNLTEALFQELRKPVLVEQHHLIVTASIGIALYPDHGINQDVLLRHADIAMYQAKARGRDCYSFYNHAMGELVIDRLKLESDLRKAIETETGMFLVYQPQWNLSTGKMVGCEALVRWRHPIKGLVHPLEFIPLAEETGLILGLGSWVLRTALAQARAWQDQGLPAINMAVNLSTAQLNKHLIDEVKGLLQEYNLPAETLELEVTETLLMTAQD
ncbi:MAG: diguanylate cyclase, partial [Pseudomonadaceae bacterium]|nr:diguanylate cyclase [Pseudomonadaceae bacterium]